MPIGFCHIVTDNACILKSYRHHAKNDNQQEENSEHTLCHRGWIFWRQIAKRLPLYHVVVQL